MIITINNFEDQRRAHDNNFGYNMNNRILKCHLLIFSGKFLCTSLLPC